VSIHPGTALYNYFYEVTMNAFARDLLRSLLCLYISLVLLWLFVALLQRYAPGPVGRFVGRAAKLATPSGV